MRLLVCGGRKYNNWEFMFSYLDDFKSMEGNIDTLINGGGSGADLRAADWANDMGIKIVLYPANWDKYGPAAGPIRNQRMLDEGRPDIVIAFPGGTGTADMVAKARAAGIKVIEVKDDTERT